MAHKVHTMTVFAQDAGQWIVRNATPEDAPAIAHVHVNSWRTTYAGIVPDAFLAGLSYEQRESYWQDIIDHHLSKQGLFVAQQAEDVVGFVICGAEREHHPVYTGEIYAIYLLKQAQGQGLGSALARAAARWLQANGHNAMLVWVLEQNPACRFYEALGGQTVSRKMLTIGGAELAEIAYGWRDIGSLE